MDWKMEKFKNLFFGKNPKKWKIRPKNPNKKFCFQPSQVGFSRL
jgi:hypothetical protein